MQLDFFSFFFSTLSFNFNQRQFQYLILSIIYNNREIEKRGKIASVFLIAFGHQRHSISCFIPKPLIPPKVCINLKLPSFFHHNKREETFLIFNITCKIPTPFLPPFRYFDASSIFKVILWFKVFAFCSFVPSFSPGSVSFSPFSGYFIFSIILMSLECFCTCFNFLGYTHFPLLQCFSP